MSSLGHAPAGGSAWHNFAGAWPRRGTHVERYFMCGFIAYCINQHFPVPHDVVSMMADQDDPRLAKKLRCGDSGDAGRSEVEPSDVKDDPSVSIRSLSSHAMALIGVKAESGDDSDDAWHAATCDPYLIEPADSDDDATMPGFATGVASLVEICSALNNTCAERADDEPCEIQGELGPQDDDAHGEGAIAPPHPRQQYKLHINTM